MEFAREKFEEDIAEGLMEKMATWFLRHISLTVVSSPALQAPVS